MVLYQKDIVPPSLLGSESECIGQQHRVAHDAVFRLHCIRQPARLRQRPWRHRSGNPVLYGLYPAQRDGSPRVRRVPPPYEELAPRVLI